VTSSTSATPASGAASTTAQRSKTRSSSVRRPWTRSWRAPLPEVEAL